MWFYKDAIEKEFENTHEKFEAMYNTNKRLIIETREQVFGNGKTGLLTDVDRLKQAAKKQGKLNDTKDKDKRVLYILMGTIIVGLIVNALTPYLIG